MLDPIADLFTRIRNAQKAGKKEVSVSASKLKRGIAKILEREGFVEFVSEEKEGNFSIILPNLNHPFSCACANTLCE